MRHHRIGFSSRLWLRGCALLVVCMLGLAAHAAETGTIRIGQSATLSSPLAGLGKDVIQGIQAHLREINAAGGIGGRRLSLVQLDDGYDEQQAERNAARLLDEGVVALIMPIGTPPALGVMRATAARGAACVGVFTGAEATRRFTSSAFLIRAGFRDEMEHIVRHLLTIGVDRIAVVHNANPGAASSVAFVEEALTRGGKALLGAVPVNDDLSNVDVAVAQLQKLHPKAVVFSSNTRVASEIIKRYRPLAPSAQFYAYSFVDGRAVAAQIGGLATGLVVSQVVPDPWHAVNPLALQYRAAMTAAGASELSYQSFEGYIAARVLTEGLRRAGPAPTHGTVRQALSQLGELNLGQFTVRFSPTRNLGSTYVDLTMVSSTGKYVK